MSNGFFALNDEKFAVGKDIESIKQSKVSRNQLIALFGGVQNLPSSIMKASKKEIPADEDEHGHARGYNATTPGISLARDKTLPKHVRDAYNISGRGCCSGALSTFPQNIGRSVVLLYSEKGQTVVDPFAGHNSRMDLTIGSGRHYIGCDISNDFMEFNQKRANVLRKKYPKAQIELHHCDSRNMPVKSNTGDMTITSPPYWYQEFYGNELEQLGKLGDYQDFMNGIKEVLAENYRTLKRGAYSVWFVNDFRIKGKMYFYHIDLIRVAKKVGFIAHDIGIVDFGKGIRDVFINQTMEQKIIPKRHEYFCVFKKPLK